MQKQEMARIMPREAHKRIKTAQSIVVIGPTSSGKSTLIYALVNYKLIKYILVGVGDKCQTTIIPCNFLFDERIEKNEYFSLQIKRKPFSSKTIHIKIMEMLAKQFVLSDYDSEDTLDVIDEGVLETVLEPADAAYHLSHVKDAISIVEFKKVIAEPLSYIENAEESFADRVKIRKKDQDKRKVLLDEIRTVVMEDMWSEIPSQLLEAYQEWLNSIGTCIEHRLGTCLHTGTDIEEIQEYSTEENDELPFGGDILQKLFDPFEPFSLIIEDLTMSCRPREELVDMFDERIPLRFCLRDTMGLNQVSMDNNSMKDALDIALNCSPDSILLLMNLEERDDVIVSCCEAINSKLGRAARLDIPINVIFTKADRVISNIVNKADRDTVELTQKDFTKHIQDAIRSMEESIQDYLFYLKPESATWLSIRYLEEKIDPIQQALSELQDGYLEKFQRGGLYKKIDAILQETQMRILPKGMTHPLFVTVKDTNLPAVDIKIKEDSIANEFSNIQGTLTGDKAVVNGYQITDSRRIHGQSVIRYHENLRIGLGYTTNAYIYGNFSINMKGMLRKVLEKNIPDFITLYENEAIKTVANNMEEIELERIIDQLDENKEMSKSAFAELNPVIFDELSPHARKIQKLHYIFRQYFASSEKYNVVIDKVAFNLSYGNSEIKQMVEQKYNEPYITYDQTIRDMQKNFLRFFASDQFTKMLSDEIGNAMTEVVNKMFVII